MDLYTLRVRAISLRREGKNPESIARLMGLPQSIVDMALKDMEGRDLAAQITALRQQGYSYQKIAKIAQCSRTTVYSYLTQANLVEHRAPGETPTKLSSVQKNNIRSRYAAGASAHDLAKEYGVSPNHVFRLSRGIRDTTKYTKLRPQKIAEIKRLINVVGLRPIQVSHRLNVAVPTIYLHQFYDPILDADKIPEDKGWYYVRKTYRRDSSIPVQKYWQCWILYHEQKVPRSEIAKALNLKPRFVKSATNITTASAYRAVWELRLKREEEKHVDSNPS